MSSRARRLTVATATSVTPWIETITDGSVPAGGRRAASIVSGGAVPAMAVLAQAPGQAPGQAPAAASQLQEREIFAKGFAEGERAGAAAAQAQSTALAQQLA